MAPAGSLPELPKEMLIEVAAHVAASSSFPMADLRRLQGACSLMRGRVLLQSDDQPKAGAAAVGRCGDSRATDREHLRRGQPRGTLHPGDEDFF